MRRKLLGTFFSLVALIALAVTPAFAHATPTLVDVNQEPLAEGSSFYLSGYGPQFIYPGGIAGGCEGVEIEAKVTENPGATAEIVSGRFEGGGPAFEGKILCPFNGAYYYDIVDMTGSINFSTGGNVELDDVTWKVQFYTSDYNKKVYQTGYCTYGLAPSASMSDSFLSFGNSLTAITGTQCAGLSMHNFWLNVTDENLDGIQLVE